MCIFSIYNLISWFLLNCNLIEMHEEKPIYLTPSTNKTVTMRSDRRDREKNSGSGVVLPFLSLLSAYLVVSNDDLRVDSILIKS